MLDKFFQLLMKYNICKMKKQLIVLPLAALATLSLIPLSTKVAPHLHFHLGSGPVVDSLAASQLLMLGLVAVVACMIWLINPAGFGKYARLGDWGAPAEKLSLLGIRQGESWLRVGLIYSLMISLGTGAFMWFGVYRQMHIAWLAALPWVLVFSLTNSFTEEMLTRFSLAAGLDGVLSKQAICWWSATIFGGAHYFGTPGGVLGVLMAGFLGWLMAKAVLETKGMGWAWVIHFLQDVIILFAFIGKT